MNKIFTLILGGAFLMTAVVSNAQTQRVGLVEEATQASCPPCASLNPALQTLMNANTDKVLFLGYQVWWPGFDQMYLDNTADIDARVGTYYGYEFAPQVKFNGTYPSTGASDGALGAFSSGGQSLIDANAAQLSEFDIEIDAEVVNGELIVTGMVTGLSDASGDLVLHLVLSEGTIYSDQATGGTNGETEYHHVMKKFLPGVNGMDIADTWVAGDTHVINETYPLLDLTIYNWDDLEVFAFVQNNDNKFIHHAVKDSDISITVDAANNATAGAASGADGLLCAGEVTVSPSVELINGGNDDLTSCDIIYSVDGGAEQTYAWTGSLTTFAVEMVTLDPITFTLPSGGSSTISVAVANPNGATDEVGTDNETTAVVESAPEGDNLVTVDINLDQYPTETSWEYRAEDGSVIASGSGYSTNYANIVETFAAPLGCNKLVVMDTYGDGLNGAQWGGTDGDYSVYDSQGTILGSGGGDDNFSETESGMSINMSVGLTEQTLDNSINIYPNPSSDVLNVSYNIETSEIITFDLINTLGAKVATRTVASSGANTITFDVTNFDSGIYQLNTTTGNAFGSTTVTIVK
jgi:hypothetical protein